jgi:hypothetical protein
MFNIFCYKANANQNDTEIPSHTIQNGNHEENEQKTNTGEDSGKMNLYTLCTTTMEIIMEVPQKN